MSRTYSIGQRAIAGVLALFFAAVFVGDSLHLALFEHEQCVEHGELVHVHGNADSHDHGHDDAHGHVHDDAGHHGHDDDQADLPVELSVTDGRSEVEHDHCDLLLATQDDMLEPVERADYVQAVLEYSLQSWSRIEAPEAPQISLMHRAPKLAPPV